MIHSHISPFIEGMKNDHRQIACVKARNLNSLKANYDNRNFISSKFTSNEQTGVIDRQSFCDYHATN